MVPGAKAYLAVFLLLLTVGCVRVPPSPLQPGLGFFTDLDEVRFTYSRPMGLGAVVITVSRPARANEQPRMAVTVHGGVKKADGTFDRADRDKRISQEVFTELREFVTRQDLVDRSLREPDLSTDGTFWLLEGRKGGFWIRHERPNAEDARYGDPAMLLIGKRFLALADVSIPADELR